MRSFFPMFRPSLFLSLRAALLLIAAGAFGACDRHSAAEVPENYGHGSSHERATLDHQTDSNGARHFSDTVGVDKEEGKGGEPHEKAGSSPTPSPGGKVF